MTLTIAIDETGSFEEQVLTGSKKRSGMAAIVATIDELHAHNIIETLDQQYHAQYPHFSGDFFHAMHLLNPATRLGHGLHIDQRGATALVNEIAQKLRERGLACDPIGIRGKLHGRRFFHEQQAWGEMLVALLHHVATTKRDLISQHDQVCIRVASRRHTQLTGFIEPGKYHKYLTRFLREHVLTEGTWPANTEVVTANATKDPYLIMADCHAALVGMQRQPWCTPVADIHLPESWRTAMAAVGMVDRPASLMMKVEYGDPVSASDIRALGDQGGRDALRRLATRAHTLVADRHATGDLEKALQLAERTWEFAEALDYESVKGELCTIAAEAYSHQGLPADDAAVKVWRERAERVGFGGWSTNLLGARSKRLEYRCQTVQLDCFNVFDFQGVYLEFLDHLEEYEQAVGGTEELSRVCDPLYGRLLGTLGQACGFLRALDASTGSEAWDYFVRSQPHFDEGTAIERAMNVGFRLVDLWDRDELDEADALMAEEDLPNARDADPYTLLHRLRLFAARADDDAIGAPDAVAQAAIRRLLTLAAEPGFAGATPFDLCLKWALWLTPGDTNLREAAALWLRELDKSQVAMLATSLPLYAQLGEFKVARTHLELLKEWPAFAIHWQTERASALDRCITDGVEPDLACLRGMPWNYA